MSILSRVKDAAGAVGEALDPKEQVAAVVDRVVARLRERYEPPELRIRIENGEIIARLDIKEKGA